MFVCFLFALYRCFMLLWLAVIQSSSYYREWTGAGQENNINSHVILLCFFLFAECVCVQQRKKESDPPNIFLPKWTIQTSAGLSFGFAHFTGYPGLLPLDRCYVRYVLCGLVKKSFMDKITRYVTLEKIQNAHTTTDGYQSHPPTPISTSSSPLSLSLNSSSLLLIIL